MAITVPFPGLVDIRQPILGDSFGWAGLEPTAAKKSLVFHHSGAENAPGEDGFSMADYHVNHNGWGGIGYHLVITRSDYPGRAGFTNPGAQVQYVGDLGTWRAHVANQNPGRVGICFAGITPDAEQLKLARALVDFFIAPNNILPSINYNNQVTVHRLVPEQSTSCPGDDYGNWLPYLQGGAFPAYLSPIVPPPVIDVTPPAPVLPEYEASYHTDPAQRPITVEGHGVDVTTGQTVVPNIPVGTVIDVAGYFTYQGHTYARTVYSATHNKWNGLDVIYLDARTGQPANVEIPISTPEVAHPTDNPTPLDQVASGVTDQEFAEATVPVTPKLSVLQLLKELVAQLIALVIRRKKK